MSLETKCILYQIPLSFAVAVANINNLLYSFHLIMSAFPHFKKENGLQRKQGRALAYLLM